MPYAITCFFIIIGVAIRGVIETGSFNYFTENIRTMFVASMYGNGDMIESLPGFVTRHIGAIWFLPALFFSLIIVRCVIEFKYSFLYVLLISYIGYKTTDMFWLPLSIQAGMLSSFFVYLGVLAKRRKIMDIIPNQLLLSATSVVWIICILFAGQFYLVRNYIGNGLLDILGALAGSYLVILFAKAISKSEAFPVKILLFFGRNSLLVLCLHGFELRAINWEWLWKIIRNFESVYTRYLVFIAAKLFFFAIGIVIVKKIKNIITNYLLPKLFFYTKKLRENRNHLAVTKRIVYWDITKGIGILSCVLGHCAVPAQLRMIIFSFHMPLFFVANGYFIKNYDIKKNLKRSAKSLLFPYIIVCLISAIIYACINRNGEDSCYLFWTKIITMIGGMSKTSTRFHELGSVWLVWFICCLFVARNMYIILMKKMEHQSNSKKYSVILLIACLGYLIGRYYAFLPWSIDVAMVSLIFVAFADWMRKNNYLERGCFYTLVLPMIMWIYFLHLGIHIELATREYPLGILSIIEAIAGTLVVISLSRYLERVMFFSSFLAWCGKNSMIILAIHCLEMMYFNWNDWVYSKLPFTINWFREFIIKITVILIITFLVELFLKESRKLLVKYSG